MGSITVQKSSGLVHHYRVLASNTGSEFLFHSFFPSLFNGVKENSPGSQILPDNNLAFFSFFLNIQTNKQTKNY